MKTLNCLLIAMIIFSFAFLHAEDEIIDRPKIGLVLSGGGARGIAHIGVLKVLEELQIEPDYITGTSMGSVIGALYAIGYTADQLEELVLEQNWDSLLLDKMFRKDVSIIDKKYDDIYIGKLPIVNYKIVLPAGIVGGQRISKLFTDLTLSAQHINDFSKLRTPFKCIATDLETGEAVIIDKGFLPEAMRTSMSIPSAFTPIHANEKLLIDGGLARNLPVIDAIEMGADIVIAVDVSSKLYEKEQLTSLVKVMEQSVNFRGLERSREQHKLCDLVIFPKVEKYGIVSFDECDSLIEIGEKAARNSYNELEDIADVQKRFVRQDKGTPLLKIEKVFINSINVKGMEDISEKMILKKLQIKKNKWLTLDKLSKAIDKLYGTQLFERVTYRLIPASSGVDLEVRVIEKYRHVLNFSFQYNSDTKSAILLNETLRNLFIEGSKLIWNVKLSENPGHLLSYFVHTGWKHSLGIGGEIDIDQFNVPVQSETDHYKYTYIAARLVLQAILHNNAAFSIGVEQAVNLFQSTDVEPENEFTANTTRIFSQFDFDTLNRTIFPQSGLKVRALLSTFPNPSCDIKFFDDMYDPFSRILIEAVRYRKISNRYSLFYGYSAGFVSGDFELLPPNY